MSSNYKKISMAEYGVVLGLSVYYTIETVVRDTVEQLIKEERIRCLVKEELEKRTSKEVN